PIQNWFFNADGENYSHKVVDFANARYQPTTVDIQDDKYYTDRQTEEPEAGPILKPLQDRRPRIPTALQQTQATPVSQETVPAMAMGQETGEKVIVQTQVQAPKLDAIQLLQQPQTPEQQQAPVQQTPKLEATNLLQ